MDIKGFKNLLFTKAKMKVLANMKYIIVKKSLLVSISIKNK